ncbi:MAG: DHH family phosphoesterase [Oscillospiraceae bacterium]|nr:DHH family phosphoesterase [Oscillospiraceae bacterium]
MKRNKAAIFLLLSLLMLLSTGIPLVIFAAINGWNAYTISLLPALVMSAAMLVMGVIVQDKLSAGQFKGEEVRELIHTSLRKLSVPVVLTEENGNIFWYNDKFRGQFLQGRRKKTTFQELLCMNVNTLMDGHDMMLEHQGRKYRVHSETIRMQETKVYAVQFVEITDQVRLQNELRESRPCVMLMVIDGYDDVMQYAKESEKAQVSAEVELILENFMAGTRGIVRKIDNDQFYAVMETRYLYDAMNKRFPILDEARKICVAGRIRVTFSIGVGIGAASLEESEKIARQSLDMALGRGGDQAAVKMENGFNFYGGASKGVEKRSKAMIRSMALALQEMIESADHIYIMGHRFGDLDAIGSACGMAGAIELMGKPASVVVRRRSCLAGNLIEQMLSCANPPKFIEPETAVLMANEKSLLIVVDTHNKDILESFELYRKIRNVVVIDHHRKNVNYIEDAALFHHEPYASSASEMVTELIQYFRLEKDLPAAYADALLAGITLDTKNFVMRTGVRTFEAAAYLRRAGADTIKVKSLFSDTISMYQMRSQIVAHAEIFRNNAISAVKLQNSSGRLLAAQAADELLSIQGVEASFVLYPENGGVSISARSLGKVNVQLIMESLGGGGHQTMAAAQLPSLTLQETKERLLQALEAYEAEQKHH